MTRKANNNSRPYKVYTKMLASNRPMHEKLTSGSRVSASELYKMRWRFEVENKALLEEAREEQNALKKKRLATCHCGKPKPFKFRECFTCNQARKASLQ